MASRKILRAEAFVVVILVKSTNLPGASVREGEEALQLATKPPRTSEVLPATLLPLPLPDCVRPEGRELRLRVPCFLLFL